MKPGSREPASCNMARLTVKLVVSGPGVNRSLSGARSGCSGWFMKLLAGLGFGLPRPARHEWGEGGGEGQLSQARKNHAPPLPNPLLPPSLCYGATSRERE